MAQPLPHSLRPGKITFEEFLHWGDEDTYAEWVDGEIIELTSPSFRHQKLLIFLGVLLQHFIEAHHAGELYVAPFLMRLPKRPSGRMPDILFIAKKNVGRIQRNYLNGPADLVVEIVSPESEKRDREVKFSEYAQAGIREYWLIDIERKQADFYQLGENNAYRPVSIDEDGIYQSAVLSGLWLKIDWLWQEPLPSLMDILKEWHLI